MEVNRVKIGCIWFDSSWFLKYSRLQVLSPFPPESSDIWMIEKLEFSIFFEFLFHSKEEEMISSMIQLTWMSDDDFSRSGYSKFSLQFSLDLRFYRPCPKFLEFSSFRNLISFNRDGYKENDGTLQMARSISTLERLGFIFLSFLLLESSWWPLLDPKIFRISIFSDSHAR